MRNSLLDLMILDDTFQFEILYDPGRIMGGRDRVTNLLPAAPALSQTMCIMGAVPDDSNGSSIVKYVMSQTHGLLHNFIFRQFSF